MKITKNIAIGFAIVMIASCSTYKPTATDFKTNYTEDGIYFLQQDVVLRDNGFMWFPSIDNPRYFLSDDLYIPRIPRITKGSKIQYKKIIFENHPTMGPMFDPVGYLIDPPFEGRPVSLVFISQKAEVVENKMGTYGNFINPDFLTLEQEKSSKQVDPIVKTPADKVEAHGTQGHP